MHLDELDEPVNVVEAQAEWSDADGEVDVRRTFGVVVDDLEDVVGGLTAFRGQRHGVRHGRHAGRQVADVKRRRISAK